MIAPLVLASLLVAALAVLAVAATEALSLRRENGRLDFELRRRASPDARRWVSGSVEIGEGVLTYILLIAVAWLTASGIAGSQWVPGSQVLPLLCLAGTAAAIVLAKLAPRGTTFWLAVEASAVVAIFAVSAGHTGIRVDRDFVAWVSAVRGQLLFAVLVSMAAAAWLSCGWLAFWTIRRGNVIVGLMPFAVAMAAEVINDPKRNQMSLLLAGWIVAAVALAIRVQLSKLDRRWRYLAAPEVSMSLAVHGGRVLAVILVAGFVLLPPLSHVDLTARFWGAQGRAGTGSGGAGGSEGIGLPGLLETGYSEQVRPGGTILRNQAQVLEVDNDLSQSIYWRGIDLYAVRNGAWETGESNSVLAAAAANQTLDNSSYLARQTVHATIKILGPAQRTLFWPGDPVKTSVATQVRTDRGPLQAGTLPIDEVYALNPVPTSQTYTVDSSYSIATEDQLRSAGTAYPDSVVQLTSRRPFESRQQIDARVGTLAQQVTAGVTTPYDQAKAIESYLRTKLNYQLQVATPPQGTDPISFFLFQSQVGYCEYFASAMGEMLRSLGVPVRLVNGYGPGVATGGERELNVGFENAPNPPRVIHAADAHTWVEVFFPSYGWVAFEPTPDPVYPALERGAPLARPQTQANAAAPAVPAPASGGQQVHGIRAWLGPAVIGGTVLAIVAMLLVAGWLLARGPRRLRDLGPAWRRLGWLGARRGVPRRDTDTPLEFSHRLAGAMPALAPEISELGRAYSRGCYRRGGLASDDLMRAEDAWRRLRPSIVRSLVRGAGS